MSILKRGHGSRTTYKAGCRCPECVKAQSAYCWAQRRAKEWTAPVGEALLGASGADPVVFVGNDITIPSSLIVEALRKREKDVKIDALTALWHKLREKAG